MSHIPLAGVPSPHSHLSGVRSNLKTDTGQWPPTAGWVKGSVRTTEGERSRSHAPSWPGVNRAPTRHFEGNGQYDGGKSLHGWMKQEGVKVPKQMEMEARKFDFEKLESKVLQPDKVDEVGQWPPTNAWVKGSGASAVTQDMVDTTAQDVDVDMEGNSSPPRVRLGFGESRQQMAGHLAGYLAAPSFLLHVAA